MGYISIADRRTLVSIWSQTIEHGSIFCDRLRSRSQDRRRSQKCVSIWSQTIAELSDICDLRSAIVSDHMETSLCTFISNFQFFMLGLWVPKRVIHHIHLTGQKPNVTEQKWIWPVNVTGDYPKIISSPAIYDQNGGKMAKIDPLFMTKTAEKP